GSLPQFEMHSQSDIWNTAPVGASLLAKRPSNAAHFFRFKRSCLKDTCRHGLKATNPCAIAYSQARIRRLVRFGVEFYRGPVADESAIGFSDPDQLSASAIVASLRDFSPAITLWRLYAGDLRVYRGA
ncbi:hypothetical protein, partial [Pseudomonas sp. PS02286]|uniref:hypothetical protein n=1 Tax=Pseudomonas sp. PS02286 TaxID=2991442 RepID=UPI00249CCBFD